MKLSFFHKISKPGNWVKTTTEFVLCMWLTESGHLNVVNNGDNLAPHNIKNICRILQVSGADKVITPYSNDAGTGNFVSFFKIWSHLLKNFIFSAVTLIFILMLTVIILKILSSLQL